MAVSTTVDMWKMFEEGKAEESKKGERGYWKFGGDEEGERTIRLLIPNVKIGEKLPYKKIMVHYLNSKTFLCLNQTLTTKDGSEHTSETCPVCAYSKKLYNSSQRGEENWDLAGQLRAREVTYYRGIIKEAKDPFQVELILLPKGIHDSLIEKFQTKRYGFIFDIKAGRDIVLRKTGKGIKSKYDFDFLDPAEITTDPTILKRILDGIQAKDYKEVITFTTKESMEAELNTMLFGEANPIPASRPASTTVTNAVPPVANSAESVGAPQDIEDMMNELMGGN